jgi:hypothetical protein
MLLRAAGTVVLVVALLVVIAWAIVARIAVLRRLCCARVCAGASIGTPQLMHESSARRAVVGWPAFGGQQRSTW